MSPRQLHRMARAVDQHRKRVKHIMDGNPSEPVDLTPEEIEHRKQHLRERKQKRGV